MDCYKEVNCLGIKINVDSFFLARGSSNSAPKIRAKYEAWAKNSSVAFSSQSCAQWCPAGLTMNSLISLAHSELVPSSLASQIYLNWLPANPSHSLIAYSSSIFFLFLATPRAYIYIINWCWQVPRLSMPVFEKKPGFPFNDNLLIYFHPVIWPLKMYNRSGLSFTKSFASLFFVLCLVSETFHLGRC